MRSVERLSRRRTGLGRAHNLHPERDPAVGTKTKLSKARGVTPSAVKLGVNSLSVGWPVRVVGASESSERLLSRCPQRQ